MKTNKIYVLIISQQVLFRQGIELILSPIEDIEVIGIADFSNGIALAVDELPPDVAILDIDAHSDTGLALSQTLKQRLPNVGIIIVTSTATDAQLFQALKAQAAAFLNKEITPDQLIDTIRLVAHGGYPINQSLITRPRVADQVLQQFQGLSLESEVFVSPLTQRETQILEYVAQGFLNKQIAAELDISEQTIKNHVTSILRKLNANARTEAVVFALKKGIISLD